MFWFGNRERRDPEVVTLLTQLVALARQILKNQVVEMSALENLKAAEANLGQSVSKAISANAAQAAQLKEAIDASVAKGNSTDDSADLQSMADDLAAKAAQLDAAFGTTSSAAQAINADAVTDDGKTIAPVAGLPGGSADEVAAATGSVPVVPVPAAPAASTTPVEVTPASPAEIAAATATGNSVAASTPDAPGIVTTPATPAAQAAVDAGLDVPEANAATAVGSNN